jgi:hypothetical protein
MVEKKNLKPTNIQVTVQPENLTAIYNNLLTYINTVVTFRFTTLALYLPAVGLILGVNPPLEKYLILLLITVSVYIIELRNRFLKNDLEARALQIQKTWGYTFSREENYNPSVTYILWIPLKHRINYYEEKGITHSWAIDILYTVILLYALTRAIILLVPILTPLILHIFT